MEESMQRSNKLPRKTARKRKRSQTFSQELIRDAIILSLIITMVLLLSVFKYPYLYSPADPAATPRIILPDWYLIWWYGFLKLWAFDLGPLTAKVGGVIVPVIFILYLAVLPFIEKDKKAARPSMEPRRVAIAMGIVAFVFTLSLVALDVVIGDINPSFTKEIVTFDWYKYKISYLTLFAISFPVLVSFVTYGFIIKTRKGFIHLKSKVIDRKSVCSFCSACIGVCPNNRIYDIDYKITESPVIPCMYCGHCSSSCHRYDYKPVSGVGNYIEMFAARSNRFGGQDGGMVTEFLVNAMDMGVVDTCVVVDKDEKWRPILTVASSKDEVLKSAGSKYTHAKVLSFLSEANKFSEKGIAIIGTPCQMEGLKKLTNTVPSLASLVKLRISLFCTENFSYKSLYEDFLGSKGIEVDRIRKVDVRRGKLLITLARIEDLELEVLEDGKVHEYPIKELDPYVYEGCKICQDFSGIYSDVSIGGIGSEDGYNTLLLRTKIAKDLYESMRNNHSIEETSADLEQVKQMCDLKIKLHPLEKIKE